MFIRITFASFKYLWDKNGWKRSLFHILNGCALICLPTGSCYGSWNSRVVCLMWLLLASQSSTRRLAIFFCFCRLSPNYTYLTSRNYVCQQSVIAGTTVKQRAFAYIMFDFQKWETWLRLRRAIFSAVNMRQNAITPRAGNPPDCDRLAEKLALLHFRLFPRPLANHATGCSGGVRGGEPSYVASKVCQREWLRWPMSGCATRLYPPVSSLSIRVFIDA